MGDRDTSGVVAPGVEAQSTPPLCDVRRILLIKWSAMGDVVIATAALQDLHSAFPHSEIHLNTMPPWDRLFRGDPRLSHVFCVDLRGRERGLRGTWRWLSHVRSQAYDLVVDLQSNDHTRILLTLLCICGAGPRYRLGYYLRFPYNLAPVAENGRTHVHDYTRAALLAAGIPARSERPRLHVDTQTRARVRALLARHALESRSYCVFLPGSQAAGHLKRWGAARYAALARRLHARHALRVLLLGGADERDECAAIERESGEWLLNLCGQTQIADIVPICESARFIVGNDTGTAHVASTTLRPMLVICGPTDPARVKPLGDNVLSLQASLPCINCYRKTCAHHSCMSLLTPGAVERALGELRAL